MKNTDVWLMISTSKVVRRIFLYSQQAVPSPKPPSISSMMMSPSPQGMVANPRGNSPRVLNTPGTWRNWNDFKKALCVSVVLSFHNYLPWFNRGSCRKFTSAFETVILNVLVYCFLWRNIPCKQLFLLL